MTSPNHNARRAGAIIDLLILHYTGMPCAQDARVRLCDPNSGVSAHYLVDEDGQIQQLVSEDRRAWHAGVSFWKGVEDINSHAIGIEIANPGHRPFPAVQMAAVTALCHSILSRHPIPAHGVLGHSDVAPTRKEDPGEFFDWAGLAEAGIGLWPSQSPTKRGRTVPDTAVIAALAEIGYSPPRHSPQQKQPQFCAHSSVISYLQKSQGRPTVSHVRESSMSGIVSPAVVKKFDPAAQKS